MSSIVFYANKQPADYTTSVLTAPTEENRINVIYGKRMENTSNIQDAILKRVLRQTPSSEKLQPEFYSINENDLDATISAFDIDSQETLKLQNFSLTYLTGITRLGEDNRNFAETNRDTLLDKKFTQSQIIEVASLEKSHRDDMMNRLNWLIEMGFAPEQIINFARKSEEERNYIINRVEWLNNKENQISVFYLEREHHAEFSLAPKKVQEFMISVPTLYRNRSGLYFANNADYMERVRMLSKSDEKKKVFMLEILYCIGSTLEEIKQLNAIPQQALEFIFQHPQLRELNHVQKVELANLDKGLRDFYLQHRPQLNKAGFNPQQKITVINMPPSARHAIIANLEKWQEEGLSVEAMLAEGRKAASACANR